MIITDDNLKDLHVRAGNLASATESLASLLEEEGISLERGDQVAKLQALRAAIVERMETAKRDERIAGYSYSEWNNVHKITGSVAEIVGNIFNDVRWNNMSNKLTELPAGGELSFSTVLVCIGPEGVPDDVSVVSVSRIARELCQPESEVIGEIQKAGNLLLDEEAFSEFIDGLVEEIMRGQIALPVSILTLSQMQASPPLRLIANNESNK